jgi:hypothetical protein
MVVAAIAVLFALVGTAIAGPDALTKLTTSKVKKIAKKQANKVFDQRAPGLGPITRVEGPTVSIPAGDVGSTSATCPTGQGIVSGGNTFISADGEIFYEDTFDSRSWSVGGDNFDSSLSGELTAIAFCAPVGKAVTPARPAYVRDRAKTLVARQKALHSR